MKKTIPDVLLKDFQFILPRSFIAHKPLTKRDSSKLLIYQNGKITDSIFEHLPSLLPPYSNLCLNNTQVIEARIFFQKPTGGIIEIFCLEPVDPGSMPLPELNRKKTQWKCFIGGASKWKPKELLQKTIFVQDTPVELQARYIEKRKDHFIIEFNWNTDLSFYEILHLAGTIPLPPYIKRKAIETDTLTYQTIFAEKKGSVAAPTASLHFTNQVFKGLDKNKISTSFLTLHIGAGSFLPVKTENIADHQMHAESFTVSATIINQILNADTVIAAGTSSLRTLESLYWFGIRYIRNNFFDNELSQWEVYDLQDCTIPYKESLRALKDCMEKMNTAELFCRTSLLIVPGYQFRSANALITNFHLPGSTLLLLVAAFIGKDWKKVYNHALENSYRFLSYGDSSLLWRKN